MIVAQCLLDGLITGSVYALIGLSFALVWSAMRTINMALLAAVALGGMTGYGLDGSGGILAALVAVALVGSATAVASYYLVLRPTLTRWELIPVVATIGLTVLAEGVLSRIVGTDVQSMPDLLTGGTLQIGGLYVRRTSLAVFAAVAVMVGLAIGVIRLTRWGLAFKAASYNPEIAEGCGVDTESVRLLSTAIAGVYAGLAGLMIGIASGSVSPFVGLGTGMKGVLAMLIGGAGNPIGAVLGGAIIGLTESLAGSWVSNSVRSGVSYAILLVIILLRPSGLLRER